MPSAGSLDEVNAATANAVAHKCYISHYIILKINYLNTITCHECHVSRVSLRISDCIGVFPVIDNNNIIYEHFFTLIPLMTLVTRDTRDHTP